MEHEYTLKVDTRETPRIFNMLKREGIEHTKEALPIGDFVYKDICIERKTIQDLVMSVRTKRLQKQLLQMQENYPNNYLLISGSFKELYFNPHMRGWTVNHQVGLLSSLLVKYNVKMAQVDNDTQLIKLVGKIVEKAKEGKAPTILDTDLMTIRSKMTIEDVKMTMFMCIPKISQGRAEAIKSKLDLMVINKSNKEPITIENFPIIKGIGRAITQELLNINQTKEDSG